MEIFELEIRRPRAGFEAVPFDVTRADVASRKARGERALEGVVPFVLAAPSSRRRILVQCEQSFGTDRELARNPTLGVDHVSARGSRSLVGGQDRAGRVVQDVELQPV